jgi:prepilin-type N-terminal cleavage/methylation domain-containing protein
VLTNRQRPDRGFSLIELLVTIVVLGILAAVAIFAIRGTSTTAREQSCVSDKLTLASAEDAYQTQHGRFATEDELVAAGHIRSSSSLTDIVLVGTDYELVSVAECIGAQPAASPAEPTTTDAGSGTTLPAVPTTTVPTATALTIAALPGSVTAGTPIAPAIDVTVLDAHGVTFSAIDVSVTIALSANPGGAILSGTTTVTTVLGIATFDDLWLDKTGSGYQLTASATGTTTATSSTVTVVPAAASTATFSQNSTGGITTSAWREQPVVELLDAFGNTATTTTSAVTLSIAPGTGAPGATLTCASNPVNSVAGIANFSGCKIGTTGAGYRLNASSPGLPSVTTVPFTVTGPATKLVITSQPTSATAGEAIGPPVSVALQDASGNVVMSSTATVSFAVTTNPGGGTLSGPNSVAVVNGVATFTNLSINKNGTGYKMTASSTGVTNAVSAAFNITVGPPAKLTVTVQPAGIKAGVNWTTQPRVAIQDIMGNTVTTSTAAVMLAIVPGSGTPDATLTCTANPKSVSAGIATFAGCKIDKPGNDYTLAVSSPDLPDGGTNAFDNPVGPATKLVITQQPTASVAGSTLNPSITVAVRDAVGNLVTDTTATVSLAISTNPGAGTLSGAVFAAVVNGVATFPNLSIDKTGNGYKLIATSPGLTSAASSSFNITASSATRLAFTTQPSGGAPGASWTTQPKVTVRDAFGNAVITSTARVTLAISNGTGIPGASLICAANPKTAASGIATFASCKINAPGAVYTLTATAPGLDGAESQAFAIG